MNIQKITNVVENICKLMHSNGVSRDEGMKVLGIIVGAIMGEKIGSARTEELNNFVKMITEIADTRANHEQEIFSKKKAAH